MFTRPEHQNDLISVLSNRLIPFNAWRFFCGFAMLLACFLLAQSAVAATVYSCSRDGKRCVAKLEVGSIGDKVRVLDEKGRKIASGRIIKRKNAYAIISLTSVDKPVRRGFPVLVDIDNNSSPFEWAAIFSYKD